eukprot:5239615-Amphidinium_carterae.1
METIKRSNCKKNECNTFEVYFGYKTYNVPFKTCVECRGRDKTKIKCEKCGLGSSVAVNKTNRSATYAVVTLTHAEDVNMCGQEQVTTFTD